MVEQNGYPRYNGLAILSFRLTLHQLIHKERLHTRRPGAPTHPIGAQTAGVSLQEKQTRM